MTERKRSPLTEATQERGSNTAIRLPAWQVIAIDEEVEKANAKGANVNRSHLIRVAVTQYLRRKGHAEPKR